MVDEGIHPVIRLLLARMESHPEEFYCNASGRWDYFLQLLEENARPEEFSVLAEPLRRIRLEEIHGLVLDELCNGVTRLKKSKELRHTRLSQTNQKLREIL